jgi:beta-galactosidase
MSPREYNPTGLYRGSFSIPVSCKKKKKYFLRMEKTASCFICMITWKEAGFNEGVQEPAEYIILQNMSAQDITLLV